MVNDEPFIVLTYLAKLRRGAAFSKREAAALELDSELDDTKVEKGRKNLRFIWAMAPDHRPENPYGWKLVEITSVHVRGELTA